MRTASALALMSALLILGSPKGSPAQSTNLGDLFNSTSPSYAPEPAVDIVAWIERVDGNSLVHVSVNATNGARLVADPGIVVRPIDDRLGVWADTTEVEWVLPGVTYFQAPPSIEVGSVDEDGLPVQMDVSYAYCLVDDICLFGDERIEVPTVASN